MATSKSMKQEKKKGSMEALVQFATTGRNSRSKAPGTRAGTLLDWREGSGKSGKTSGGRGNVIRDGC